MISPFFAPAAAAVPITVRYQEGTQRGFLILRNQDGVVIASGELLKVVHGDCVTARLLFHFHDGSVDDETAVYTQHTNFHLLTDHHLQKGPSFKDDLDFKIDAASGRVTLRSTNPSGRKISLDTHLDLPADLSNGMILSILCNIRPSSTPISISYLAPSEKPRLIRLVVSVAGHQHFTVGGLRRTATDFLVKPELGGLTGIVAPMLGKQPASGHVWIAGGEAPAFVRDEHQYFEDGPLWTIEQVAPVPLH